MRRPFLVLAPAAIALGAVAIRAPAQGHVPKAVVMVRDATEAPVAGVRGLMLTAPRRDLPALRGHFGIDPDSGSGGIVWARPSRQTGMLQFIFTDGPRSGGVLISADNGLGALLPWLQPGDAHRLQLEPVGNLTSADDKPCILYATATIGDRRIVLPPMQAATFPLPAASYELWIRRDEEVFWQRVELASGAAVKLSADGAARRLERSAGAWVSPTSRPDLVLLGPDAERCTLRGHAIAAPLDAHVPATGLVLAAQTIPAATSGEPLPWPVLGAASETFQVQVAVPEEVDQATVQGFVVRRHAALSWTVLGKNRLDGGTLRLPAVHGGDDWLLLIGDALAAEAWPLAELEPNSVIRLTAGKALPITCRFGNGSAAADVMVEYVPAFTDVATVTTRTDRSGRATFGPVTFPGSLRVSDPGCLNSQQRVDGPPSDGSLRVTVELGVTLRGQALLPDGSIASGATITLRDPRGWLRPAQRTLRVGEDGTFTFTGLPAEVPFTLFATQRRDGRTWSSQLLQRTAGDDHVAVTLRNEDPERPGRD